MNDKLNKTSIFSIVALDIIDYSKKTIAEQAEFKKLFNDFIHHAVIDIPQDDRVIVDTISGAAIACSGSLEDALEDALFISITIRDEILKHNTQGSAPLYVQFAIHLGAVRVVKNTMVGDGIEGAQRIMSFANPNQILVSNVYFEMASKLTQEMAQMFEKYEMHAHEHDVYAVRLLKDTAALEDPSNPTDNALPTAWQLMTAKINWTYVVLGLLLLAAFFVLAKLVDAPIESATTPATTVEQPVVKKTSPATELAVEPNQDAAKQDNANQDDTKQDDAKKANVNQKKTKPKATVEAEDATNKTQKSTADTAVKSVESKTQKDEANEKSGWQTFKDSVKSGTDRKCSQAEIALNQCVK